MYTVHGRQENFGLTHQLVTERQTAARSPLCFPLQQDGEEKWIKGETHGFEIKTV